MQILRESVNILGWVNYEIKLFFDVEEKCFYCYIGQHRIRFLSGLSKEEFDDILPQGLECKIYKKMPSILILFLSQCFNLFLFILFLFLLKIIR